MNFELVRMLDADDVPEAERELLSLGRREAVEYDTVAGAARLQANLAALAGAGAVAGVAAATGGSTGSAGKALLAKLAGKVLLGMLAASALFGAGMAAGMHFTAAPPSQDPSSHASRAITAAAPSAETPSPALAVQAPAPVVPPEVVVSSLTPDPRIPQAAPAPRRTSSRAMAHGEGAPASAQEAISETVGKETIAPSQVASAEPAPPLPSTASAPPAPQLNELQTIAVARGLVDRDPEAALRLLDQLRSQQPHGYFDQERDALTVLALARSGQSSAARDKARAFLRAYPNGPLSDRVRAVAAQ
jgi:hypothetical protein